MSSDTYKMPSYYGDSRLDADGIDRAADRKQLAARAREAINPCGDGDKKELVAGEITNKS